MVNLKNVNRIHGQCIEAEVRVMNPQLRTAKNGKKYLNCTLVDSTDSFQSYLWEPSQADSNIMIHGNLIKVFGRVVQLDHQFKFNIERVGDSDNFAASISTLPINFCPIKDGLMVFQQYIDAIQSVPLKNFIHRVFADPNTALPYLVVPASKQHHHNHPSGLLVHSIEVACICKKNAELVQLNSNEAALLITAALMHDVGKTRTHLLEKSSAWINTHEVRTLEILSPALEQLKIEWPDGAEALRYLLTWKQSSRKEKFPMMPLALILEMADKFSASRFVELESFSKVQHDKNYAKWTGGGPDNRFWRPCEAPNLNQYN